MSSGLSMLRIDFPRMLFYRQVCNIQSDQGDETECLEMGRLEIVIKEIERLDTGQWGGV